MLALAGTYIYVRIPFIKRDLVSYRKQTTVKRDLISSFYGVLTQEMKEEGAVVSVVSKRELRRQELTREKLDKMSFRALTRELSNECGVVPEVTGYREALWPDVLALEGSQEFANMLLWEAALRGNHSGLASLVRRGADVHARDDSRGGWCSGVCVCARARCVFACLCARARECVRERERLHSCISNAECLQT